MTEDIEVGFFVTVFVIVIAFLVHKLKPDLKIL